MKLCQWCDGPTVGDYFCNKECKSKLNPERKRIGMEAYWLSKNYHPSRIYRDMPPWELDRLMRIFEFELWKPIGFWTEKSREEIKELLVLRYAEK